LDSRRDIAIVIDEVDAFVIVAVPATTGSQTTGTLPSAFLKVFGPGSRSGALRLLPD
jgi:hypothetical protein